MQDYALLAAQIRAVAEDDSHWVPVLANASALIFDAMPDLNWAGFYLMRNGELVLGPFQGKVACVRIQVGRGVCGTAVAQDATQLVANVHDFPGHIACDSASNSEVVVPLHSPATHTFPAHDGTATTVGEKIVGVLDIDSPSIARFTDADAEGLELVARAIEESADFAELLA